jgi:hypothetical protein
MADFKFNVQTFDKAGKLVDNDNYKSVMDISKAYTNIPYFTIYYIIRTDGKRKPNANIAKIMKRFKVTLIPLVDDEDLMFTKS